MQVELLNQGSLIHHLIILLINMGKATEIRRNLMLADMDIRFHPDGTRRIFSIKFVTKEGKLYFVPQAYACGAGKMNMKLYQLRGIQPCDCKGNKEGHLFPVNIDNIIEFNQMKVIL